MLNNLTRSKVAHNLHYSPYILNVEYEGDSITFVFSSKFNQERFNNKIEENREIISHSLSKRFNFIIKNSVLSDLKLYTSIEKRGFLVKTNKDVFECLDSITLDGSNLIMMK